ncbi:hypothetical protein HIM_09586 [Hirsutella minnesotensis 3608]|uniref:Uncharacterized protein n=1 Tax=Hirsutella minnesotensis 3608 TaxID=1043627 RepID=A0A0F7ZGJ9_9HYPO|nr:hypothetical protein HIM_09586 [Hirsutella minnesotensis 3608]
MAYQTRIQYLKRRTKELNCGFDDKACLWFTIKGLREVYPQWYTFLERDMNKGTLTWESLMTEMYAEANKEKTAMALPSLAKNASGTSSPQNSSTSGHSRKLQSEQTRRFCSTCNKSHWVGLPLCSFCKKHHPGGEAECFEKHPEKLDEYRRRNKRQGSGESPSNEAATNMDVRNELADVGSYDGRMRSILNSNGMATYNASVGIKTRAAGRRLMHQLRLPGEGLA